MGKKSNWGPKVILNLIKMKTLFIFLAFAITLISAQKAYQEEEGDEELDRLVLNRAQSQPVIDDIDRMPSKSQRVPLLQRFQGNSISNAAWESRG